MSKSLQRNYWHRKAALPEPPASGSVGSVRLLGVPIRLHFTFVLLLICLVVIGLSSNQSPGNYTLFVLAVIASVLLHEFGHAFVSSLYGIRTIEIVMYPIGGVARLERPAKPWEEFWIALTGPAVNLAIAAFIFALLYSEKRAINLFALVQPSDANLADRIALANLILAGFNLLPAFPMDGGRMLRAVLSRLKSEYEATRIATWSGRMLAISMGLYGFINMPMLAFVAFFIYLGAANEGAASRGRSLTQGIPVRAAMMTEYHTLAHGATIRDAANLLLSTSQQDFPVVLGDQVLGLAGPQCAAARHGAGGARFLHRRIHGARVSQRSSRQGSRRRSAAHGPRRRLRAGDAGGPAARLVELGESVAVSALAQRRSATRRKVKQCASSAFCSSAFCFLASAENVKLYLKDGSYQLVREYKVENDRVQFLQPRSRRLGRGAAIAGGSGQNQGRNQSARRRGSAPIAAAEDAEKKAERAARKEVASVPADPGVYLIDDQKPDTENLTAA